MLNSKIVSTLAVVALVATVKSAFADVIDTSTPAPETRTSLDSVTDQATKDKKKDQPADGDDADDVLTNNELRAISGAKKKLSFASTFNYLGGTITTPFAENRPNISAGSATTDKSDIDGEISAKYNINQLNSILVGGGVRWVAPTSPGGPSNFKGNTFDAYNPYITYQHIYKWLGVQSVIQYQFQPWTQSDFTAVGYQYQFSIDQENMKQIGKTKLSIGASTYILANTFDQSGADVEAEQSNFQVAFSPVVEYAFTDKYNFRTVANVLTYDQYRNKPSDTWFHDTNTESVGLGISITRDFFLYPNIQFLPEHINADETNVGVTATINL